MGDKYCGLGNIVKGVKKRKKKSDLGQRNYSFGYDDQLRTNESVHTLLSKLDIVDKKLEKFDQNHPLPTHQQGVLGNMDNCYPKLQVQLPENWLELMKECESHGKKPCLEVSVKSDCNCREESQKGATYSRQEENNRSRSDRRSCSCEKARRNVLDTCCSSTYQRQANYLDDRRDEYPSSSSNNRQYGLVESSLPCGEPPNQIPPLSSLCGATSELSEFAPATSSKKNRLHCRPRIPEMEPRCEEFDEEADYPDNNQLATSELSKFAPATSSKINRLHFRPRIAEMEPRCEEFDEEADYPDNNQLATSELSKFAPATSSKKNRLHFRPRIAEMEPRCEEFDEEADYPDNNQLATSELSKFAPATSTKKNGREYDAEDNAPYNSDCRLWKASSKCREFQSNPCPSCRTATPINCCRDATQQNDSEVIGPSRIKNRALKEYNKCDTSPNCLCAQAICMIQNCSNRKQRKCSQQSGPSHADEPAYKKPCCTIYGNCESQFSTLVVNIPRTPIVTSSPADESSCIQNVVCGFQGNGKVEFGRITPIKSCECDTKKDIIGASQSPQQTTKSQTQDHDDAPRSSTNSHEEPGQLEKECSVPPKKNSHHENDETDDKESHHKPKTTPGRKDSKGSHKCGSYCVGDHHHTKWDSPKTKSKPQKQDDTGSQSGNTDLGRASKDESPQKSKATPERQNVRGSQSGDTDPSSASKDESPRKPKATPEEQEVRGSQSGNKDPSRASKDASPQKAKTTESEGARGSQSGKTEPRGASKEASPRSQNSTPEDQKLENDGAEGAASEKEKANSSSDGKVEFSLVMKNEVKFEGQGESETPINLPEKQRLTFPTSDLPSAPLLLLRRGFVQMPQASLTPSETNLNNSKECDLRSCSIRRSPQRDLYIGEGTILTSHPSNISMHNEFLTVPKAAFTPQSSRIKPITDSETQTPRGSTEDIKVLTVTHENYQSPLLLSKDESLVREESKAPYKGNDGFNPQNTCMCGKSQLHDHEHSKDTHQHSNICSCCEPSNSKPVITYPEQLESHPMLEHSDHDGSHGNEKMTMRRTWKLKAHPVLDIETPYHPKFHLVQKCLSHIEQVLPFSGLQDSKKHNNDSLDKYKLQEHRETERSKEEKQLLTKIQNIDKTKPKLTNLEPPEKMKDIKVKWNEALSSASGKFLDQPWQRHEGDLRTPQFSPDVTFWNVPSSEPQWVQQRNNPEPDRRAKSRGRKNTSSRPTRSNSLNSGKSFARICNSERERIHKLARKCLKKRSPSRSLGEKSTISSTNKETKNNYGSVSQSFAPPESENRGASSLNQKYLKELIFPFAHKGPELLEQDESGTQKNVQKFVIERIIRINPCSRDIVEASQHSDTDEDKEEEEEEEFGPRNTTTILEAFIGSKPAISGTSTCPTGYAPSAGSRAVSDLFRDTFMRFCGTEEDGRSEDNLFFHTFPNFDDPSDQPRDIFDDATAGDGHQSSDEKTRKYELMEEFLRDSMLRSLYSNLQGEAANPWGSTRDGYQNKAKTMVFHQDTKCTSLAPTKQVQTTSTEDNRQYTHCLPSDPPMNVIKDPYDAFKELIWNSQFTSSDTHKSDSPVQAPRADSQVTMAPHVNDETKKDQNDVHQKSSAGLQKYSEIMDLLEIFPGQHRREDPQEEKTRKWIEKINKNLEDEKEQGRHAKSNKPKGERIRAVKF
ncbi:hypothetical protein GE061_014559 [Apolygus lucorum]|uniref:Uncharacterized protein n=1 Tax=Apolygus lucorum TaxID=248454 RepID=A0A8S9XKN8_APOLU|nr:hypothetical protein GE061_014559 [Apolygus lucorum]